MKETNNHLGETVGVFKIIELMPGRDVDGHALYKGICKKCGLKRIARYSDLKEVSKCSHIGIDGRAINRDINWKEKHIRDIFYGMRQRCYDKNNKAYKWYGGKGIKICDEWLDDPKSFEEWALQNGYSEGLTIDRIDSNKNYSPDNCRWISFIENVRRSGNPNWITANKQTLTGRQWSEALGLSKNLINKYVKLYGLINTVDFIEKRLQNLNLKPKHRQSYYELYMCDMHNDACI